MIKIAIVHDYFFQAGGAEKVVETMLEIYPNADIYTSFFIKEKMSSYPLLNKLYQQKKIKTTLAQLLFTTLKLNKFQKHFFWLYAILMRLMVIKNYDLVIISSTFCAKYVRFKDCKKIVYYCHSPTRFLYNLIEDKSGFPWFYNFIMPFFNFWLTILDQNSIKYLNKNNCSFFSNSLNTKNSFKKIYKKDSFLLYPPVEVEKLYKINRQKNLQNPFYYYCGRISFHKKLDIAILACIQLQKHFFISGSSALSSDIENLQKLVVDNKGEEYIHFLGRSTDDERNQYLSLAKAFIFPYKEDFGITPVESLAIGCPVIAYQKGGSLEYIKEGINGIFFKKQTVEDIKKAILNLENNFSFDTDKIKNTSLTFSKGIFLQNLQKLIK